MNLPGVRYLKAVFGGKERDLRCPAHCLDLALARVWVARAHSHGLSDAQILTLMQGHVRGLVSLEIGDGAVILRTRDETSEYAFRVTLPTPQ